MNKVTKQFNQSRGLPSNYSNSLRFLDMMYRDPIFKRSTVNQPRHRDIFDTIRPKPTNTMVQQINNTNNNASTYDLPKFKKLHNPLNRKSLLLHLIIGLLATILLGLVLIAVFGGQDNRTVLSITRSLFGHITKTNVINMLYCIPIHIT